MDSIALVTHLVPAPWLPYVKGIVATLGSAASVVLAVYPGVANLHWYVIASAIITIAGTYFLPNVKQVQAQVTTVSTGMATVSELRSAKGTGEDLK
jgi:hypothetical protein